MPLSWQTVKFVYVFPYLLLSVDLKASLQTVNWSAGNIPIKWMVSVKWMDWCFVRERASIQMQQTVTQPCSRSWEGNGCYDVVKFEASDIRSVYQSFLAAVRSESVTAVLLGLFHTGDPVDGDFSPRDMRVICRTPTTTRNLSAWLRTYSPHHLWKWTLSTMLELEDIIAVWAQRELRKKKKCDRTI